MPQNTFLKITIVLTIFGFGIFSLTTCSTGEKESVLNSASNEITETKKSFVNQTIKNVKIGNSEIQIVKSTAENPAPLYFRPHENESTSSDATKEIIGKYGGTFVEIKSKGQRLIEFTVKDKTYNFDPNRIFSIPGIENTLGNSDAEKTAAVDEVERFVKLLFSEFLTDKKLIIAVHNNTNEGQLSVETYKKTPDAAQVFSNPNRDIDDFFYVTDIKFFNHLKAKGFNVILQDNAKVSDDGSLSVYCGKNEISYINVESEHGHLLEQIEMMTALQEIIKQAG